MVVLHLPIGLFSFAALLELVAWFRPFEGLRRVLAASLGLGVLMAIVTAVLGLYRSSGGDYSPDLLMLHRNTGIAMTVVAGLTLVLHSAVLQSGNRWLWWYRGSLGTTLALLMAASHYGGSLTHGEGFLTQNAPQVIRNWMARWDPPHTNGIVSRADSDTNAVVVTRLFEAKCLSCHGPEKQKGQFRIDQRESLLKGGESGVAAVVPGDPGKSGLFRMILLPVTHEEVMPPAGKQRLTDADILAVFRWIQAGAP
jgi:mono/diheme cytochrome c family protein